MAQHYAQLVHASHEDALAAAKDMQAAIHAFLAAPSALTLGMARERWLAAREFYGQTEAFRFYGGPIDDDHGPEGRLNAWPLDESYVDHVQGKPQSGFIGDAKSRITKANIAKSNERGGEENVSAGWHAIEFLLWGQDLSETGPGNRSFEDYVDGKAPHANRRRQYLRVVTELLMDDLGALVKAQYCSDTQHWRGLMSLVEQRAAMADGEAAHLALDSARVEASAATNAATTGNLGQQGLTPAFEALRGERPRLAASCV